jgi:hypothetical protein
VNPATLDEPPAPDADDVLLAAFLEEAFGRFARGEDVQAADLLAHAPRLIEAGQRVLADARDLFVAAVGLRSQSRFLHSEMLDQPEEPAPPAEMPDPFPGEYRLVRRLGQGTFGSVWLAEDLHLGRSVALKLIRPTGDAARWAQQLTRMREEARLLAAVRHPHVVEVYAWRERADVIAGPCLVLRHVAGGSLADRIRREGPLPWPRAARYLADLAEGLRAVHAAGIVHRDVKPANILWDPVTDEAVLTDFGISIRLGAPGAGAGTPFYTPPEALAGEIGPAQDVYGLAATLFWLVTGSVPFPVENLRGLAEVVGRGLPNPDPRCAVLPAPLERLIRAGLAANPCRRPGLDDFTATLRGTLNQLLADDLLLRTGDGPAGVRLTVSRQAGPAGFLPVAASAAAPERFVRDLKRVPPAPERVQVRTGDRIRVEVSLEEAGFVTVFNVGPTGNLDVLFPEVAAGVTRPVRVGPERPLHLLDVQLTPPAGQERLFALWSRQPLPLDLHVLGAVAAGETRPVGASYQATRDMTRIQNVVQQLGHEEWSVTVLNLCHLPPQEDLP